MHTVPFIIKFIQTHEYWANVLLFLGMIIEGEIILILAGILIHQHALHPAETMLLLSAAALLKTVFGYQLGSWIARRFPNSRFLKYVEKRILLLLPRFRERPFWSIFISKFIYGVNNATLIFAGYMKTNFPMYVRAEIISTIIWLLGFLGLGYFFSFAAFSISGNIRQGVLLILIFIGGFLILQRLVSFIYDLVEYKE